MTNFDFYFSWDVLEIWQQMNDYLQRRLFEVKKNIVSSDEWEIALEIVGTFEKCCIVVLLEDTKQQITIKGGIEGKYLPIGKRIPKFSKVFSKDELLEASEYFEFVVREIKDGNG